MLLDKLEAAFERRQQPNSRALYTDKLMSLPLATGAKRVDMLINTAKFFPKIAELLRPVEGEVQQINANIKDTWSDTEDGRYSVYRSERLVELGDAAYWEYLYSPAERARLENVWRQEFAQQDGRAG